MAGLVHDGALRRSGNRCAGGVPCAKAVARVLGRIESRMLSQLLHDPRHVNGRKATRLNLAVTIDSAKG